MMDSSNKENKKREITHKSNDQNKNNSNNTTEENWHDQLLQFNANVAMESLRNELEINNMDIYCKAMREELNELELEVTKLEGQVELKEEKLIHLQEKEALLSENLKNIRSLVDTKEEISEILQENHELLKEKNEIYLKKKNEIIKGYEEYYNKLRENYESTPLVQKRIMLINQLKKSKINVSILKQKHKETEEQIKLIIKIRKRQEQIEIIKFAQLMVNYYKVKKLKNEIKFYEQKLKNTNIKRDIFQKIKENRPKSTETIFKVPAKEPALLQIPTFDLSKYKSNLKNISSNTSKYEELRTSYKRNYDFISLSQNTYFDSMLPTLKKNNPPSKIKRITLPELLSQSTNIPQVKKKTNNNLEILSQNLEPQKQSMKKNKPISQKRTKKEIKQQKETNITEETIPNISISQESNGTTENVINKIQNIVSLEVEVEKNAENSTFDEPEKDISENIIDFETEADTQPNVMKSAYFTNMNNSDSSAESNVSIQQSLFSESSQIVSSLNVSDCSTNIPPSISNVDMGICANETETLIDYRSDNEEFMEPFSSPPDRTEENLSSEKNVSFSKNIFFSQNSNETSTRFSLFKPSTSSESPKNASKTFFSMF